MKYFDLWNLSTGNLVADSREEHDLLAIVREMVTKHGADAAMSLSLGWGDDVDEDAGGVIAEGKDLIERALRESSAA